MNEKNHIHFALTWITCFVAYTGITFLYGILGIEQPWYVVLGYVILFPTFLLPLCFDLTPLGNWVLLMWPVQTLLGSWLIAMLIVRRRIKPTPPSARE